MHSWVSTQYMRNLDIVYMLKMKYLPKINVFDKNQIPPCAKLKFDTEIAEVKIRSSEGR